MSVPLIVAYAQSSASNQNWANASAPAVVRDLAKLGNFGGFSPGRALGPVVGTVGVFGALEVGAGEELVAIGEVARDVGREDGDDPPDPPVHPVTTSATSAIRANSRYRIEKFSHERPLGARVVHRPLTYRASMTQTALTRVGWRQPPVAAERVDRAKGALLRYRVMAFVTGIVLIAGCVALIVKYGTSVDVEPWAGYLWVAHGYLYLVYLVTTAMVGLKLRWPIGRFVLVALAGTVPTMSFVAEHYVTRATRQAAADPVDAHD